MKFSKLLWNLLFGIGAMQFGVTGDEGGGEGDASGAGDSGAGDAGGDDAAAAAAAAAADAAKGGKISDAEAKLLKEVMDKKNALKKANDDLASIKTQLAQFEGIDPVAVKALLKQQKDAETAGLEAKGEWDRLKKQMGDEHTTQMQGLLDQLNTEKGKTSGLEKTIAELTVGNAFGQSNFIREELSLTPGKSRVIYGTHFAFEDGAIVGYDKPAGAAERTLLVDAKGDALPFEDALRKIVDADPDKDQLLKSKIKAGAGSKTAGKTAAADLAAAGSTATGKDRISGALTKAGFGSK